MCFCALAGAPPVVAQTTVDISTVHVGPDSFRLGEYSGLQRSGNYFRGNFTTGKSSAWNDTTGKYWQARGLDLGLDTLGLRFDAGARGRYDFSLAYQQLPHYRFDGPIVTPFTGAATARQTLPSQWVGATTTSGFTRLHQSLQDVSVNTNREHLSTALSYRLTSTWTLDGNFQRQRKNGSDTLGAMFGNSGGNARSALLAAPVDYVTDNFDAGLSFRSKLNSFAATWRASLFSNANTALQWQNPFNNTQWAAGAGFSSQAAGQLALAPDNQAYSLDFSGVHSLNASDRISGSLAFGRMTQDETFLPYSNVFTARSPLPATSLDGKIRTLNGMVNYTDRVSAAVTLKALYSVDIRDNDTQRQLFLRIPGDTAPQAAALSDQARINRPYSHTKQRLLLQSGVRLDKGRQLQLEYGFDRRERDLLDVDTAQEQTASIRLLFPAFAAGRGSTEYTRAQRRGSGLVPNAGFLAGHNPDFISTLTGVALYENDPLLRRFHIADRDRDQLSFSFTGSLLARVDLNLSGKLTRDEFPDSSIGLQSSAARHVTANLSYAPARNLSVYAYQTYIGFENSQSGYSRTATTPILPEAARLPGNGWQMRSRDRINTSGLGMQWNNRDDRYRVNADLLYSDAASASIPQSSGLAYLAFPEVSTRFVSFTFNMEYNFKEGRKVGLRYRHDDYRSTDFALDSVVVDSLNNVLLLGNSSPVYAGSIIELRFTTAM